jgi:hypothetical protein
MRMRPRAEFSGERWKAINLAIFLGKKGHFPRRKYADFTGFSWLSVCLTELIKTLCTTTHRLTVTNR